MSNPSFLNRLEENIKKLDSQNGKLVVHDGKRIGAGVSATKNMIKGTTVSKTKEDALIQEKYEKSVMGNLFGDDIPEDEVNKIVDKYVEKIVDELFEGI